ncbi:MlaD family protein [Nocardia pseudovaccinii]|uniref:MlaD family protein n=1 Tax=Nocardia pseudovaccinii TaxID=189540 RepID=UPI0007A49D8D|nr:MlaD family protein [Nocardia pseudovaccinii]
MNSRRRGLARLRGAAAPGDTRRRELRLGLLGLGAVVVLVAVSAVTYALPLGKQTYRADLSEAGSIRVGDSVRVAGIPVGTVRGLELLADRVRLSFTVDSDVFIGDATTLDVRMLTAIGGHYLAVLPAGRKPLGDKVIESDRVRLPYSLMQVFQDAASPVGAIDGNTLRENFAALGSAISTSPDGVRRLGQAMDSLVGIMNSQREDISRVLAVADEYMSAADQNKQRIFHLLASLRRVEDVIFTENHEIMAGLSITNQFLARLTALRPVWDQTLEPLASGVAELIPELRGLADGTGSALATIQNALERLRQLTTPQGAVAIDQSAQVLDTGTICIPLPGAGC